MVGIGNSSVLESHGITTLVDLPGVGEQFQEHLFVATQWQLQPGIETFGAYTSESHDLGGDRKSFPRRTSQQCNLRRGAGCAIVSGLCLYLLTISNLVSFLSAKNRSGLLAATDSLTAFVPLRTIVSKERLQELLGIFDKEANATGLPEVQKRQYEFQREWLTSSDISAVELILWSKGLSEVKKGESYAVMLGGLMVGCYAFGGRVLWLTYPLSTL